MGGENVTSVVLCFAFVFAFSLAPVHSASRPSITRPPPDDFRIPCKVVNVANNTTTIQNTCPPPAICEAVDRSTLNTSNVQYYCHYRLVVPPLQIGNPIFEDTPLPAKNDTKAEERTACRVLDLTSGELISSPDCPRGQTCSNGNIARSNGKATYFCVPDSSSPSTGGKS